MSKVTKKKRRRKMSRGGGKKYFTKEHEDAIVQYALSDDRAVKTKLYVEVPCTIRYKRRVRSTEIMNTPNKKQ